MEDYRSKYTGEQVDALLDRVEGLSAPEGDFVTKAEFDEVLGDVNTILESIVNGSRIVNKIRVTLKDGSLLVVPIVNPDTLGNDVTWAYPVTSQVSIVTPDGDYVYIFEPGDKVYGGDVSKYWPVGNGELSLTATPAEDDNYIYVVEVV